MLVFVGWIAGAIYCDRVADERGLNQWIARVLGLLLPGVGPAIYWTIRNRSRLRHRLRRRQRSSVHGLPTTDPSRTSN